MRFGSGGWMRWVTLVSFVGLAGVEAGSSGGYEQLPQRLPDRTRSIRGFKNVALSTARGFGKRSPGPDSGLLSTARSDRPYDDSLIADAQEYMTARSPDRMAADWFAEEMTNNGLLAKLVVDKFLDEDHDGVLSPRELLRPLIERQPKPAEQRY